MGPWAGLEAEEKEKSPAEIQSRFLYPLARSLVAIPTELSPLPFILLCIAKTILLITCSDREVWGP
jgi:hypothetical protein